MEILALKILGGLAYAVLEYWLGKTDKVKAGSVIEAIIRIPTLIKEEKDGKARD